jgi:hypothetical protein
MTRAQQTKEELLYPTPSINPDADLSFPEIAQTNNLNNFSHHVQLSRQSCYWW